MRGLSLTMMALVSDGLKGMLIDEPKRRAMAVVQLPEGKGGSLASIADCALSCVDVVDRLLDRQLI